MQTMQWTASIEHTHWNGEPAVRFSAGGYEALMIPGVGANVIELKDLSRGLELLRCPSNVDSFKARPQVYGVPVLFPPNRIEDGTFTADGRVYNFTINDSAGHNHIHGYLRTRPWQVTRAEVISEGIAEVEAVFLADKRSEFFPEFPHEFEFKLICQLSSKGLLQTFSIKNMSDLPMPMGLGLHTAFNVPFHADSKPEDYRLLVSVDERWELTERILPTGRRTPLEGCDVDLVTSGLLPQGQPYQGHFTSKELLWEGKNIHGAILRDLSKKLCLMYETGKDFSQWVIWNENGANGFICPEPQTWAINAPNVKLPPEETGFRLIPPGETWEASTRIYVEEM